MRANKNLKLHERCVDVCDMIISCDKHLINLRYDYKRYQNARWDQPIRFMNSDAGFQKAIAKYENIKRRLTQWYIEINARINDTTIEYLESNAKPVGNFIINEHGFAQAIN